MSDQGAIPNRRVSDFKLIETLLWTRDEGFFLLAEHLERLRRSSAQLGFRYNESRIVEALTRAAESFPDAAARLRVRIVLSGDGAIESSAARIEPVAENAIWTVAVAERRFDFDRAAAAAQDHAPRDLRNRTREFQRRRSPFSQRARGSLRRRACKRVLGAGRGLADAATVQRPAAGNPACASVARGAGAGGGAAARRFRRSRILHGQFGARIGARGVARALIVSAERIDGAQSVRLPYFCEVRRSSRFSSALCNFASPSHSFGSPLFSLRQIW